MLSYTPVCFQVHPCLFYPALSHGELHFPAPLLSDFLVCLANRRHWWKSQGQKKQYARVFSSHNPVAAGSPPQLQFPPIDCDCSFCQVAQASKAVFLPFLPFDFLTGNVVVQLGVPFCSSVIAMRKHFPHNCHSSWDPESHLTPICDEEPHLGRLVARSGAAQWSPTEISWPKKCESKHKWVGSFVKLGVICYTAYWLIYHPFSVSFIINTTVSSGKVEAWENHPE